MLLNLEDYATVSRERRGNTDLLKINRPECGALVSLTGGQVLAFTPHGYRPLLWENKRLDLEGEGALRQGIPVCWPWFGALENNPQPVRDFFMSDSAPAHGLVRQARWQLVNITEYDSFTDLELSTERAEHKLELRAIYRFGASLQCRLITCNHSTVSVPLTMALHTYLAIDDIGHTLIDGLDGIPYVDALDQWRRHKQSGKITVSGEVDRIYYRTPDTIIVKDDSWKRSLVIYSSASSSAIVWNPWVDKSYRLSQFEPAHYRHMLCIETARAWEDYVSLAPGETNELDMELSVRPAG